MDFTFDGFLWGFLWFLWVFMDFMGFYGFYGDFIAGQYGDLSSLWTKNDYGDNFTLSPTIFFLTFYTSKIVFTYFRAAVLPIRVGDQQMRHFSFCSLTDTKSLLQKIRHIQILTEKQKTAFFQGHLN